MRKTIRAKELARFLERCGFVCTRTAGSHVHYLHPDGRWTTIPLHNGELKKGTLHGILKSVGMTFEDLD